MSRRRVECSKCKEEKWIHKDLKCRKCWDIDNPEIALERRKRASKVIKRGMNGDETEEEIDAIIAQQMKKLPKWFLEEKISERNPFYMPRAKV